MFGLLITIGILGALLILPLLLIGGLLRLVLHIAVFPFHLLGAVLGLGIAGVVLAVIGIVIAVVLGAITLVGAIVFGGPVLLAVLVIWALLRLLRGERHSRHAV